MLFLPLLLACVSEPDPTPDADSDVHSDEPPAYGPAVDCGEASVDLIRWPYLQDVRIDQVRVAWGAEGAVLPDAVLHWGPDAQLGQTAAATGEVIPGDGSEIALLTAVATGLEAGQSYCYAVEVGGEVVASGLSFQAAPASPTADVDFTVLGDYGHGTALQARVRDAMLPYADEAELHLTVGDNAYGSGQWDEWQRKVFSYYGPLWSTAPIYPTPGNHDHSDNLGYLPYLTQFWLPENAEREEERERYWSMDWGAAHFVGLDSERSILTITGTPDDDMFDWLRRDLEANDRPWTFVFWHHPPLSEDPDRNGHVIVFAQLMPLLDEYDVDVAFMGHDHFYVRYHPLRNWEKADDGVHYVMTGGGGGEPRDLQEEADPRVAVRASVNQFMWVQVTECTFIAQSIDETGEVLDELVIDKC